MSNKIQSAIDEALNSVSIEQGIIDNIVKDIRITAAIGNEYELTTKLSKLTKELKAAMDRRSWCRGELIMLQSLLE